MNYKILLTSVLVLGVHVGCNPDEENPSEPFDLTDEQDMGDVQKDMAFAPDQRPGEDMPAVVVDMVVEDMNLPDLSSGDMEDMRTEDMLAADMEPDQAPDMPVVVLPLREVVEIGLMGDMPMENYIKDPQFTTLNSAYSWIVTDGSGRSFLPSYRHITAQSPMRAATLKVPKNSGDDVTIYGEVNLHINVPVTVSVWVGRKGFALGGSSAPPSISIYTLNIANFKDFSGVDLALVPGSAISQGGIRWARYEAQVSGMAGYGWLSVQDDSSADLYLHAPMAVAVPPSPLAATRAPALPRIVTDAESSAIRQVNAFVLEQRSIPAQARETGPTPYPF